MPAASGKFNAASAQGAGQGVLAISQHPSTPTRDGDNLSKPLFRQTQQDSLPDDRADQHSDSGHDNGQTVGTSAAPAVQR